MLQDYSFPDSTFTLIADIDCEGRALPTGEFAGTFDGQGNVISNLVVEAEGDEPVGLFGTLSGTVRDVILVNPVVTGGEYVGALAGEAGSGFPAWTPRIPSGSGGLRRCSTSWPRATR